jgi:hypothetical protein
MSVDQDHARHDALSIQELDTVKGGLARAWSTAGDSVDFDGVGLLDRSGLGSKMAEPEAALSEH